MTFVFLKAVAASLFCAASPSILTVTVCQFIVRQGLTLNMCFLRNKTGYLNRNFLTKTCTHPHPGPNLINVGPCIFYITIPSIIAILEIPQCENDDQFIIHCSKSQQRLHLIEFVLYFVAGCLLATEVVEILSTAIPALAGGGGVSRKGGGKSGEGRKERKGRASHPLLPADPPVSSQTINW